MDLYVGNLPYDTDDEALRDAFSPHANVEKAKIILDRETGRSRGFGFVTISDPAEAEAAIEAMNGAEMSGRPLRVNAARERTDGPPGGGGGGGGGHRGGGGGGYRPRG